MARAKPDEALKPIELSKRASPWAAPRTSNKGFTLVELLVVITIIVILLALLTPAMEKAIYQAELTACGAQLRGLAQGLTVYAMQHKRAFPPRIEVPSVSPNLLADGTGSTNDLRIPLRGFIPMNVFQDPLSPKIAYDGLPDDTELYGTYKLWYNWQYANGTRSARLGSPFSSGKKEYYILVSDYDEYNETNDYIASNHPDREGKLAPERLDAANTQEVPQLALNTDGNSYLSRARWLFKGRPFDRGLVDLNFAEQDNSVYRVIDLKVNDGVRTDKIANEYLGASNDIWYNRVSGDSSRRVR